jgi:hypothetical protein
MSRLAKKRPDADAVYICWQSFATEDHGIVTQGERRRGSDPAVRANFEYFHEDGLPTSELPTPISEHVRESEERNQDLDGMLLNDPREYQDPPLAILRRDVRLGVGLDEYGLPKKAMTVKRGTRFLADSEIVRAVPHFFEVKS